MTKVAMDACIIGGALYIEDVRQCHLRDERAADMFDDPSISAIRVISLSNDWTETVFYDYMTRQEALNVEYTMRRELRGKAYHWYAYRRVFGKLYKRYIGRSEQITELKLAKIGQSLPTK